VPLIPCILDAAKSTEDLRGSIPDQLQDCRSAVEHEPDRMVVGEYADEAFSAFRRNRGPRLEDALREVALLAREHGTAELWAQHSDRLARGDGRTARHANPVIGTPALAAVRRPNVAAPRPSG
jgi:hypothetical protein